MRTAAHLVLFTIAACVGACQPPRPPPPRPTEAQIADREQARQSQANARSTDSEHARNKAGLTGGKLVFSDNFDGPGLADAWRVMLAGEWTVTSGELSANRVDAYDDRNKGVWLNVPLPEKTRIEFRSRSLSKEGDMKCEVFATEQKHEAGYSIIFGGWSNTINTICRLGEHEPRRVVQVPNQPVQSNRKYKWTVVRTDNTVRWYIDDKFMVAYEDKQPVKGRWFGFNNWLSDVRFDDLRVWDLK